MRLVLRILVVFWVAIILGGLRGFYKCVIGDITCVNVFLRGVC